MGRFINPHTYFQAASTLTTCLCRTDWRPLYAFICREGYPDAEAKERRWAQTVFQQSVNRLREEQVKTGNGALFELREDFQPREPGAPSYAQIGARFGMTEAAVKRPGVRKLASRPYVIHYRPRLEETRHSRFVNNV